MRKARFETYECLKSVVVSFLALPHRCNYNDFEGREICVLCENPDVVTEMLLRQRPNRPGGRPALE
jgi:hypothetical protein